MKVRRDTTRAPSLFAFAAFVLTLMLSAHARAQSSGLALEWQAPTGCPTRDVVLNRLRRMVGKSLDRVTRLRAQGRIESVNARYRLTLHVREGEAETERVIDSDSCADLAGAAAVALGLLVRDEIREQDAAGSDGQGSDAAASPDADAVAPATPPEATPEPASPASASEPSDSARRPAVDRPPEAPPAPPASRTVRFLLRAPQVGIDVGPLPHPSPTVGVSAGLSVNALELTLGARLGFAQTLWAHDSPAYGAEVRRAAIELRGCYAVPVGYFSFGPCLFSALEVLSARGVGDEVTSYSESTGVFAVGAAALAKVHFTASFAVIVSVGGQVETTRPQLLVDGLGEIATLAPLAFTTNAGLEWSL